MTLELSDKEQMLLEAALRIVLNDLMDCEEMMIEDFTAVLTNLNRGSFGKKNIQLEDPNDWMGVLPDMREILDRLNPEWVKMCEEHGAERYIEEDSDYNPLD